MSIARNFFLGREITRRVGPFVVMDRERMQTGASDALSEIGIDIRDADEAVGTLSGGERQSIAIGRAVHFGTRLLILDEPTSALSISETRKVLSYIRAARDRGLSVIFITHNLRHVFEVSDRLTVLAHGTKLGDFNRKDTSEDDVANMIMGSRRKEVS
jgi:simple sugar transport system ATP-binding protein